MKTIMSLQQVENIFAGGFEILWELPKCDRDMKRANAFGKTTPIDLLDTGFHRLLISKAVIQWNKVCLYSFNGIVHSNEMNKL